MCLNKYLFKISGSVATRTTIVVLILTSVIVLISGIWQAVHVRDIVASEMDRSAKNSIQSAIKVIENRVTCIETAVETAASYANMFATSESSNYRLLERLIVANKDISAVTLMYRADYFPSKGRYYAPTITRHPVSGKLEEDEIGGPEYDFCYLETDSNWVYTTKLDKGYWCLPYVDSISTKRAMVSYSVPLHDDNDSIYAILCADVDLHWVQDIVEEAKPYNYCDFIVMSRDSQYICHPNPQWILARNVISYAKQKQDTAFLSLADRMLRRQSGNDTLEMSEANEDGLSLTNRTSDQIAFFAPVSSVLWSICFLIPEDEIMSSVNSLTRYMMLIMVLLQVVIAIVLYKVIHFQLRPLTVLAESTRDVAQGHFDAKLPAIYNNDEIGHLRDSFKEMQASLSKYVEELQTTTAQKASMENELNIATNIQMSMLPKVFPPYPDRKDIDIFGSQTPAKAVGGDLFDFFIRDEKLFFCIGDVSGKGVPAALVMAVTCTRFRIISAQESHPARIVKTINDMMAPDNDTNMFVTLFVGVLDLKTGQLCYSNAGHDAPLLFKSLIALQEPKSLKVDPNLPVGIIPDWEFTEQEEHIEPQDILFFYTDGLTEAEDVSCAQFGLQRIIDVIKASVTTSPQTIIEEMKTAVRQFVGEAEQSDDLTMLAIEYRNKE